MKAKGIFALLVGMAVVAFLSLWSRQSSAPPSVSAPAPVAAVKPNAPSAPPALEAPKAPETEQERRARMISDKKNRDDFKLSEQDIYSYLVANRSNAVSLVTAFEATRNREFLKIAAAQFPNDPFVQSKVLLHDVFPEERGKWIDAFKQSSPENAFGNLLAAQEAMKRGDMSAAMAELAAGKGKAYDDFTRESSQGLEEAYLAAGRSVAEAKVLGMAEVTLPHLAQLKGVGGKFLEAAEKRAQAGDVAGQLQMLQVNWEIGSHFRKSPTQGTLITDLVGLAMQNLTLKAWPANVAAPFLDAPASEVLAANQEYRKQLQSGGPLFDKWFVDAPESEIISYMDRTKSFGELAAIEWLKGKHPELVQ